MAINFPDAPTINQVFTSGVFSWTWDGTKWKPTTIAAAGTVSQISAGTGITLTPSPIQTTGSVALTTPVTVASGGTGATTLPAGQLLQGQGTSAVTGMALPLTVASGGTGLATLPSGQLLQGAGTGAVTGVALPLAVASGGTGQTSLLANSALVGNGTGNVVATPNLTLDAAGNVLHANSIGLAGATVPSGATVPQIDTPAASNAAICGPGGAANALYLYNNVSLGASATYRATGAAAGFSVAGNGNFSWQSYPSGSAGAALGAATQTMSLDGSGNLTATGFIKSAAVNAGWFGQSTTTGYGIQVWTAAAPSYAMLFYFGGSAASGGGTGVGTIACTSSTTAYNTTSDARLKSDIEPIPDAGAIIDKLKPIKFNWRNSEEGELPHGYGFAAQEAAQVFPQAVTLGKGSPGEEDFVPDMMDYSKLVPLLVAEVQRLRKLVESR